MQAPYTLDNFARDLATWLHIHFSRAAPVMSFPHLASIFGNAPSTVPVNDSLPIMFAA